MDDADANGRQGTLDVSRMMEGSRLVVVGGTGFVGKLFWSMLLDRFPGLGRLFLVGRPKNGGPPETRFLGDVGASETLEPLPARLGGGVEAFLRQEVQPSDGDMI